MVPLTMESLSRVTVPFMSYQQQILPANLPSPKALNQPSFNPFPGMPSTSPHFGMADMGYPAPPSNSFGGLEIKEMQAGVVKPMFTRVKPSHMMHSPSHLHGLYGHDALSSTPSPYSFKPRQKYPCRFCSKSFTRASNRSRHERQHTGVRPYACDLCNVSFTRSDTLQLHKQKIHNIEPDL
jgi:hypothetical protein